MMKSFSRLALTSSLFALSALAGCATDDAAPTPGDPSAPITAIALDNGNEIQFLEPSPGLLLVSELGVAGVAPQQLDGKSALEVYRQFAPGQKVPQVLLAAQDRSDKLPADVQPSFSVVNGDSLAEGGAANLVDSGPRSFIDNEACDDAWFNNTFCIGSYDWSVCRLNMTSSTYYAQHGDTDYVHMAVCSDIGTIKFKATIGNGDGGIWTLTQGQYRTYSWKDNCVFGCNQSSRVDVSEASGNRYHVSMRVNR